MSRVATALATLLVTLSLASAAAGQPPILLPAELAERLAGDDPPIVLDVRTEEEWSQGHIPGATHIPLQQITERRGEVAQDRDVVVHCQVAPRARMAEKALIMVGHERVFHLEGGFRAWQEAGLAVEQ